MSGRARAYLELARATNLPTVWTNVLVGAAIGAAAGGTLSSSPIALSLIGTSLLYTGGMALNDVADAAVDRSERPGGPIPSGRVSRRAAGVFAGVCLLAGVLCFVPAGGGAVVAAVLVVVAIVAYDLVHGRLRGGGAWIGFVLMATCRVGAYCLGALAVAPAWANLERGVPVLAAALGYTVVLSAVARAEVGAGAARPTRLPWVLIPVVIAAGTLLGPAWFFGPAFFGGFAVVWLAQAATLAGRAPVRRVAAVLALLAGFCVVDAYFLACLNRPAWAAGALGCLVLTRVGHRRIVGT